MLMTHIICQTRYWFEVRDSKIGSSVRDFLESPYLDYLAAYYLVPRLLKLECMTSDGLFDYYPSRVLNVCVYYCST
jgi:hypothetical protein